MKRFIVISRTIDHDDHFIRKGKVENGEKGKERKGKNGMVRKREKGKVMNREEIKER